MKEFSDKKNIEMEKRKELLEGGKSIQANLAMYLPILEDSLKTYILNHPDQELQFRLDCIMTLFGDIYLVYRDSNGILQKAVDKVSDQLVEYNSLAGFRDYILKKLAEIRDFILDPTEENILSVCVNMSDVLLGYNAMVNYEIKS